MARPESVALGGYYKTPPHITQLIARLVDTSHAKRGAVIKRPYSSATVPDTYTSYGTFPLVDPCAGDGEAIADLAADWFGREWGITSTAPSCRVYAAELEKARAEDCRDRLRTFSYRMGGDALHGDAFCVNYGERPNAAVLYLNPPYDHDDEYGRLEQRFLDRYTHVLNPGYGILLFVVPYYALAASADHIAREYDSVFCYRFPDPDYAAYKQVVLVATRAKRPLDEPNPVILSRVQAWASDPNAMPILRLPLSPVVAFPESWVNDHLDKWSLEPIDTAAAYAMSQPWKQGTVGKLTTVRGVGLDVDVPDMIGSVFPVAMPPRPAHVAIALAAGLVNGREVHPDDPASPFPPLVVKGTFIREYHEVEEKKNKDGDTTAVIMVQQPRLTVSVLDMVSWTYHDLTEGSDPSGATAVADMNVADLLTHYGMSLAHLMHEQCPPLFSPDTAAMLYPDLGLKPFKAQGWAIESALRMLFATERPFAGENPFILGEVGTGKTLISLVVAAMLTPRHIETTRQIMRGIGLTAKVTPVSRVLVICPPHLLDGWSDQVRTILPGATVRTLQRVSDVEAAAAAPDDEGDGRAGSGLDILVLSREMAKLGHAWGVGAQVVDGAGYCPVCGGQLDDAQKAADVHLWCETKKKRPSNEWARLAGVVFNRLSFLPEINGANGRYALRQRDKLRQTIEASPDKTAALQSTFFARLGSDSFGLAGSFIAGVAAKVEALCVEAITSKDITAAKNALDALESVYMAMWSDPARDALLLASADRLYHLAAYDNNTLSALREPLHRLILIAHDTSGQAQMSLISKLRTLDKDTEWLAVDNALKRMRYEREGKEYPGTQTRYGYGYYYRTYEIYAHNGTIRTGADYEKQRQVYMGTPGAGVALLRALKHLGEWTTERPCHTPLFTAVAQPRRVALADYIKSKHPNLFDLLIIDEAHEYAHDGSAQERAAHRLAEMGKPVLVLTGTSNNGYASSLFMNMWSLSRRFREEFGRDGVTQFVNRYGYRKVKVEPKGDGPMPTHIGVMSDRTDTGTSLIMRKIGEAPGVMPLFILKHLLPISVSIHKDDLDVDLPPLVEAPVPLAAPDDLRGAYLRMRETLVKRIMDDLRGDKEKAGKLWGALAQLPSFLDRCHDDTGNVDFEGARRFELRYPVSVGGALVACADAIPAGQMTPKEEWVLDKAAEEVANGRPVTLLVWHTGSGLAERYLRLAQARFGKKRVALLDATRVQATKRQEWIDRQIKAGVQVLISNPKAIETGLNNLVYFSTAIWVQNPNVSSIIFTQANGRFHRPGQKADEVRVFVPYYADTTQEIQHILLAHKVQASRQTDGLDISSALAAAGAGAQDTMDAMTIGKAIYKMLMEGGQPVGGQPSRRPAPVVAQQAPRMVVNGNGVGEKRPLPDMSQVPAVGKQMKLLEGRPYYAVGD